MHSNLYLEKLHSSTGTSSRSRYLLKYWLGGQPHWQSFSTAPRMGSALIHENCFKKNEKKNWILEEKKSLKKRTLKNWDSILNGTKRIQFHCFKWFLGCRPHLTPRFRCCQARCCQARRTYFSYYNNNNYLFISILTSRIQIWAFSFPIILTERIAGYAWGTGNRRVSCITPPQTLILFLTRGFLTGRKYPI